MLNLHTQGKLCLKKKFYRCLSVASLSMASTLLLNHIAMAADETVQEAPTKNYSIPAGPLSNAISDYAAETGVRLTFDPSIAKNKQTKGLDGEYSVDEGFNRLLKDSGLEAIDDQDGGYFLVPALPPLGEEATLTLEKVNVRAQRFYELGPLPGLGLTKEEIPGNVQSISAEEIKESHSLSMADLFNSKLQGVTVNDYQGNPFQMDVQYRGFTAGPQIGTPQGLSVFFDGIRVNEPFGDVVNWDLIPMNAIASVDVFPGSNPIFGLNTLGGAFTMKTKDGFNNTDTDIQVLKGSFGREQLMAESGWNNGTIAFFGAGSFFMEDGWRENSPSEVNQFFGKASYRGDKLDLNLSTLIVDTKLVGNGLIPSEEYRQDRNGVFTSPDTTENRLQQFQLSAAFQVNDKFSITGQVYRRDSKRDALGADVYTDFEYQPVRRALEPGEEFTCLFESTNQYNLPDYYVLDLPNGDFSTPVAQAFLNSSTLEEGFAELERLAPNSFNEDLPDYYADAAKYDFTFYQNLQTKVLFEAQAVPPPAGIPNFSNGPNPYIYSSLTNFTSTLKGSPDPFLVFLNGYLNANYTTADNVQHVLLIKPPINGDKCIGDTGGEDLTIPGPRGGVQTVDGGAYFDPKATPDSVITSSNPGVVEGTPTAVFTNNTIDQITDGASIQFNWNLEKHKFMVGASIDRPSATYTNSQQLGLLDSNRNAYLAPDEIRDQYAAADVAINNNDFNGDQTTKSIYFSETWSPVDTWHFNFSARYNDTHGQNTIASRTYGTFVWDLAQLQAYPDYYDVCSPGEDCNTGYDIPDSYQLLNPPEKEEFSYYSLNPSLGAAWQAREDLNLYANFAQGVRVPSVIELGCALDKTPVGGKRKIAKSIAENRTCSLPNTLSGDPYLPQIKAETWEVGMRGIWRDSIEWNLSAYRTNLKDDIYLISFPNNKSFFDTIGKTRRQGIEAGLSGETEKWGFSMNYSLTEATFQDTFLTVGNDNSSSFRDPTGFYGVGRLIEVNPGDRMPGVPLHNLNATVSYKVTPKWQIGITAIAHSESYVRGNENNKHEPGKTVLEYQELSPSDELVARKSTNNPGKVPGYMTFNLNSSYNFTENFRVNLLINNLFDKEYFTAGMLGRNPFTPGTYGAIGPDGYNHNSLEWKSTNFIAPGAPRGAWLSLNWIF